MFSIQQLADIVNGKITQFQNEDVILRHIVYDSRQLSHIQDSVFFALTYGQGNGHEYLESAYKKGVRCFLVSQKSVLPEDASIILVDDTLVALQKLATYYRNQWNYPVLGVTGSNGKTIVKEWISQLLEESMKISKTPLSFNSQLGVPLSVLQSDTAADLGIFEAGISQPGEMEKLHKILKPEWGILTHIGTAHLHNFKSENQLYHEKLKLFQSAKKIILPFDVFMRFKAITPKELLPKMITWGSCAEADITIIFEQNEIRINKRNSSWLLRCSIGDIKWEENLGSTLSFIVELGKNPEDYQKIINQLDSLPMRLEQLDGYGGGKILNDAYSLDIQSLRIGLNKLEEICGGGKKAVIITDFPGKIMGNSTNFYHSIGELFRQHSIKRVVCIGEEMSQYLPKGGYEKINFLNTDAVIQDDIHKQLKGYYVLVKGARKYKLERLIPSLSASYHETRIEINLTAIRRNLTAIRTLLQPNVKIMAMVKASAYGAGTLEMVKFLKSNRVDYFGVAYAEEGMKLRQAGIKTPIMVMNSFVTQARSISDENLEPALYSLNQIQDWVDVLHEAGKAINAHIEINTGMNRLGLQKTEWEKAFSVLKSSPIKVVGIFSHLAAADNSKEDKFTQEQLNVFNEAIAFWEKNTDNKLLKHISNTAGAIRFPQAHYNMVRLGIGLHGYGVPKNTFQPVYKFVTHISQINQVNTGGTVGYNRTYIATEKKAIATIPVGYADGLIRQLGRENFEVIIHGKKAPIVGEICMDMCMIDITNIPNVLEGDEVIIFDENHTIETMAKRANTIVYEVLTGFSERVRRVFYEE